MKVEIYLPRYDSPKRIAIIGETPSLADAKTGVPFSGYPGDLLGTALSKVGVHKAGCMLALANPFANQGVPGLKRDHWGVTTGSQEIETAFETFNPNVVLLLGELPLRLAGENLLSMDEARGSLFVCRDETSPFFQRKCITSYAPHKVQKQWDWWPLFRFDVKRAVEESDSPELVFKERDVSIYPTFAELKWQLEEILRQKPKIAFDIEGYAISGITCCSIALSSSYGFSIYFPHYLNEEQVVLFRLLHAILADPAIEKIMQNGLYDQFCCSWKWKTPIRGHTHDTLYSGWEIFCELPKKLAVQLSIWAKVPAYKWMRAEERLEAKGIRLGQEDKLRYNVLDSIYTYELHEAHMSVLKGPALEHYRFNMRANAIFAYIMRRGIRYNHEEANARAAMIVAKQKQIMDLSHLVTGVTVNPNSPKQMNETFYKKLRFEPQYRRATENKPKALTCDNEALLNLRRKYQHPIIDHVLQWRALDGVRKQLIAQWDEDGRMRASYSPVGTDTGRLNCSKSPSKRGLNLQTITKKNRDLYMADEGRYFFQCDLEGADGWTVAAHCAFHKDNTMLDDYLFGLKPAKILALMFMQNQGQLQITTPINKLTRQEIKELIKTTTIPEWLYFTSKRAQHATNYGSQPRTMAVQIMKDSYKYLGNPIMVDAGTCLMFQQLYLSRYPGVASWQLWVKQQLEEKGYLVAASGHLRNFLGRPGDPDTYRAALSHEPQANTTYATNLAMLSMWEDPENRLPNGLPRCEPLHQVHDAGCGQFFIEDTEWVKEKMPKWFNNTIVIAGINIVIPYAGGYGPHWGAVEPNHPDHKGTL